MMAAKKKASGRGGKHGPDGRFVGRGPAKPSLAQMVDARLVALEQGISRDRERAAQESRDQMDATVAAVERIARGLDRVYGSVDQLQDSVARVPEQAARAAVGDLERRLDEGTKQLHRRVVIEIFDAAGVRMAHQSLDLAVFEVLTVDVAAGHFAVRQSQPGDAAVQR